MKTSGALVVPQVAPVNTQFKYTYIGVFGEVTTNELEIVCRIAFVPTRPSWPVCGVAATICPPPAIEAPREIYACVFVIGPVPFTT